MKFISLYLLVLLNKIVQYSPFLFKIYCATSKANEAYKERA